MSKADNSRPSPRQTIADQSILRSAVLPASPMPLFLHTQLPNKTNFWQLLTFQPLSTTFCNSSQVILSSCHHVILSSCHLVILSSCHLVILSACELFSLSAFQIAHLGACELVYVLSKGEIGVWSYMQPRHLQNWGLCVSIWPGKSRSWPQKENSGRLFCDGCHRSEHGTPLYKSWDGNAAGLERWKTDMQKSGYNHCYKGKVKNIGFKKVGWCLAQ